MGVGGVTLSNVTLSHQSLLLGRPRTPTPAMDTPVSASTPCSSYTPLTTPTHNDYLPQHRQHRRRRSFSLLHSPCLPRLLPLPPCAALRLPSDGLGRVRRCSSSLAHRAQQRLETHRHPPLTERTPSHTTRHCRDNSDLCSNAFRRPLQPPYRRHCCTSHLLLDSLGFFPARFLCCDRLLFRCLLSLLLFSVVLVAAPPLSVQRRRSSSAELSGGGAGGEGGAAVALCTPRSAVAR